MLYYLPPLYNIIFTIDHLFLIGFRSRLDGVHSLIIPPVNLLSTKNLLVILDTEEGVFSCLNTHFTLKLQDYDLYHTKKIFSRKYQLIAQISLTCSSTLNGSITVWSTIPAHIIILRPPCYHLFATGTCVLHKIHPFDSSIRFIKYYLRFVRENQFIKVNFHAFLGPVLMLYNICFSERRLSKIFLQIPIHKVF